ncbi:MAG: CRISPR-associated protein Crm3 [Candidatus Schekmanbacteria bacterium]|nr:CRISPR-associated protein Crm3 [Candidatus Schekmanbacteria bacterium]
MTRTARVALVPRDGIFCKDGRGWHTSASGRGHGLDWPWPSTILGALRSAWGRAEEARIGAIFGPDDWRTRTATIRLGRTLALRRRHGAAWGTEHATWPVPLDALWLERRTEVHRLDPVEPVAPTLGRDDDKAREDLMRPFLDGAGKPLPPPRWWSNEDFSAWLAGHSVPVRDGDDVLAMARRLQVHVGILPEELTADEGVLFSHDVIETLDSDAEWAIGAEAVLPDGELSAVTTLGSDGRLVRVEPLPDALFEPPALVLEAFRATSIGLRIAAVTPICFERGWLPVGLERQAGMYRGRVPGIDHEVILRAAFVPRPSHVSGWDMAAGAPKPTSRLVAPGAVYFFERTDAKPFGEVDARSLWLAALGERTDEGFGRVVPGVWSPKRSTR